MRDAASQIAKRALDAAMTAALSSLPSGQRSSSSLLHRAAVTATGAIGGAFGMAALPLELPTSTVLMLRSIADIARAEGEDLDDPETALACLAVFALGGRTPQDDQLDSAYFTVRLALAESISEASHYIGKGVVDMAAPPIIKLMSMIASRYGLVLSQKMAAQAVPVVGALGGAMVNLGFIRHLERIAQGHFKCRGLARFHPVLRRFQRHFDQLAHRRQQDLPDRGVDFRAEDGDTFNEHVRHVTKVQRHIDFQAFAVELDTPRLATG
jgi:hypothetical protein